MARVGYVDLRGFIDEVDRLRALRRIEGADPYLEIGGIPEVAAALPDCPALLFDRIKGYRAGFRVFTNATTNLQRAALALGIDPTLRPLEALKAWMEVRGSLQLRKPVQVPQLRINADLPEANIGRCRRVGSSQQRHRRLGHCRFLRRRGFEVVGVGDLFAFGNGSLWVRHDFAVHRQPRAASNTA